MHPFLKITFFLSLTLSVHGAGIDVNFDGNTGFVTSGFNIGTSADTALATTAVTDDTVRSTITYGTTLATNGSDTYTGPTMQGGLYMNAIYTDAQSTDSFGNWASVSNSSGGDYIKIRRNGAGSALNTSTTRAVFTFDTGSSLSLDDTSSFSLTGGIGSSSFDLGHWIVVSGGITYISETTFDPGSSYTTSYAFSNPDATNWAEWTPNSSLSNLPTSFTVAGFTLTSITQVGFYFEKIGGTSQNPRFSVFTADLALEPASAPLYIPTSLTATPISLTQIDLAWIDSNTTETGYVIESSPNDTTDWSTLDTLPADSNTYSDTGLLELTTYFYRVKAIDNSGQSDYSSIVAATTTGNAPDGATDLSATALNGTKVQLDWTDQSTNETSFRVERAPAVSGPWSAIATIDADSTTYTDRTALPDATYFYRVVASVNNVDGAPSTPAIITTPLTSTVNFLIFGNSYSHFYEYLPSIAASLGDAVNFVAMRNGNYHTQLQAEQDEEDGLRTLPAYSTSADDGFSPLETSYSTYVRMKDILDQQEWDVISFQAHSSYANKFDSIEPRADGLQAYFDQPHHEPSAEIVYYHTTQYRNDEHLFRNLVNTSAHRDTLHGSLPYTGDQHTFDAFLTANQITATYGYRAIGGGLAQQNLRHHPTWGHNFPDPYFDYFNATSPGETFEPANRKLHYGFSWPSSGTSNNPKFAWKIDSHPHILLNYLTACVWYEVLFRKDVRNATYAPSANGVDAATFALIREVAHRTVKGELPPLRLADQTSRTQYADLLWSRANTLLASSDSEEQDAGEQNLIHLYGLFPEHAQHAAAGTLLTTAGRLDEAEALLAKENAERSTREAIYQAIWDSSTDGNPITIDLSLDGDPDGDGIPARVEKALNLNPHADDSARMPQAGIREAEGSTWFTMTHRRQKVREGFTINVEASETLLPSSWDPLTNDTDFVTSVIDEDLDGTGFTEAVEQRIRFQNGIDKRFFRLSIADE